MSYPETVSVGLGARTQRVQQQTAPGMRGILLYVGQRMIDSGEFDRAADVEGIAGLTTRLQWAHVERQQGHYDWTLLDKLIAFCRRRRLDLQVGMTTGVDTPAWIYQMGVPELTFQRAPADTPPCTAVVVPPPWHPVYLEQFGKLIREMGRKLSSEPLLRQVRLTGINVVSEELHMPTQKPSAAVPCMTDSRAIWDRAGYGPQKVERAWGQMLRDFGDAFPGKRFCLSVIPSGLPDRQLVDRLAEAASREFPGRLTLQYDSLLPFRRHSNELAAELARKLGVPMAWQTNLWLHTKQETGAACGGERITNPTPCTERSYQKLLETGFEYGVPCESIEVFPNDAAKWPGAIARVSERFGGRGRGEEQRMYPTAAGGGSYPEHHRGGVHARHQGGGSERRPGDHRGHEHTRGGAHQHGHEGGQGRKKSCCEGCAQGRGCDGGGQKQPCHKIHGCPEPDGTPCQRLEDRREGRRTGLRGLGGYPEHHGRVGLGAMTQATWTPVDLSVVPSWAQAAMLFLQNGGASGWQTSFATVTAPTATALGPVSNGGGPPFYAMDPVLFGVGGQQWYMSTTQPAVVPPPQQNPPAPPATTGMSTGAIVALATLGVGVLGVLWEVHQSSSARKNAVAAGAMGNPVASNGWWVSLYGPAKSRRHKAAYLRLGPFAYKDTAEAAGRKRMDGVVYTRMRVRRGASTNPSSTLPRENPLSTEAAGLLLGGAAVAAAGVAYVATRPATPAASTPTTCPAGQILVNDQCVAKTGGLPPPPPPPPVALVVPITVSSPQVTATVPSGATMIDFRLSDPGASWGSAPVIQQPTIDQSTVTPSAPTGADVMASYAVNEGAVLSLSWVDGSGNQQGTTVLLVDQASPTNPDACPPPDASNFLVGDTTGANVPVAAGSIVQCSNAACVAWNDIASDNENVFVAASAGVAVAPGTANVTGAYTDPATGNVVVVGPTPITVQGPQLNVPLTIADQTYQLASGTKVVVDPGSDPNGTTWSAVGPPFVFVSGSSNMGSLKQPTGPNDTLEFVYTGGGLQITLNWDEAASMGGVLETSSLILSDSPVVTMARTLKHQRRGPGLPRRRAGRP